MYLSPDSEDPHANLNTLKIPFNRLSEKELCLEAGGYRR
jgi:hypothetical protein